LFLINPPYGESKGDSKEGKIIKNSTKTNISKLMKSDDLGYANRQLYVQFLYRIIQIQKINKNIKISIFTNSLYKTAINFSKFRDYFYKKFNYKNGMIFQASHFNDVSKDWGIDFSIFDTTKTLNTLISIKDINDMEIIELYKKDIYNTDNKLSCSDWIRNKIKKINLIDIIQLKTALQPKQSNVNRIAPNSIGYLLIKSNKIKSNTQEVGLYTSATSNRGGVSLLKVNLLDGISLFTARKTIKSTWDTVNDEYIAPSEEIQNTDKYKLFNNDAIVYSLFNSHSQQSSMRQVEYKEKLWDIKNEFFWLSKEEMMNLADEYYFDDLYKDAKNSDERFVYKLLNGKLSDEEFNEVGLTYVDENNKPILSDDAKELLELSKELIKKSFELRKMMNETNSEYHLQTWDAGWYQIKKVLNEYFKDDYKIFVEKYKAFEDRLRPQVYDFGMLLK